MGKKASISGLFPDLHEDFMCSGAELRRRPNSESPIPSQASALTSCVTFKQTD